ncbi:MULTISPECIES: hypothetical protein [unclassified Microbacterium]|uniref:hypothetical protein n=1 Tax=unclassified Microbacterium TaxID=2609290 RepID=UPI00214CDBC0|nr:MULTISPECIES: hypothetical protein [unclassified Microbacterium]MCR2784069.1 hypothetical protein [Microbacterium sp. zg.B96]MDL5351013.1 hypothetical protein [Microbacterium sp. zg-YB36]WIM15091.1 hypothetical protein QNO11_11105 [Microbacterium sp. zg-B96]
MTEDNRATIQIDDRRLDLPQAEAWAVFREAISTAHRGGFMPISQDTAVSITKSTRLSLTIRGEFAEAYQALLTIDRTNRDRTGRIS